MAGSVKKEGNSWYYILELGKMNGKRKQKKKRGFNTKKEALKALNEAEYQINKGTFIEESDLLYKEFLDDWLNDKKTIIKKSTYSTYSWLLNKYVIPKLGDFTIKSIKPQFIQSFYNDLINNKIISRNNVQKTHTIINDSLNKAVRWGLISKNVATLVDRPKAEKTELKVWEIDEVKTFLKFAKGSRYYIAFLLALTTGCNC